MAWLEFSPFDLVGVGTDAGDLLVYRIEREELKLEEMEVAAHSSAVRGIQWSLFEQSGEARLHLLTAGSDGYLRVWAYWRELGECVFEYSSAKVRGGLIQKPIYSVEVDYGCFGGILLDVEGKFNPHKTLIPSRVRPSERRPLGLCFKKFPFADETTLSSSANESFLYVSTIDGCLFRIDKKVPSLSRSYSDCISNATVISLRPSIFKNSSVSRRPQTEGSTVS